MGLKEPCVLTCTGYEYMTWTDRILRKARARINETRYETNDHYVSKKKNLMDELFDDYEEEERRIQGFNYKEEDNED